MDTKIYVETFLNVPLAQSFFYTASSEDDLKIGMRIEVPFRTRKLTAFVVGIFTSVPTAIDFPIDKLKPLKRIIDKEPIFTNDQVSLALWMEKYYLCSRGEALSAMLPSGKREKELSTSLVGDEEEYVEHTLSDEQQTAIDDILFATNNTTTASNIHYLYGSTGSGKTEVFLRVAQKMLKDDKGVIYLVPEIGLTHQVIEAVFKRFGETVAVLHSGLTGSQRLEQWKRILNKKAKIVIGARSAIFAPVPDLGLIIIDEEHDGSYKSNNSPRYSARQIAMRRCNDVGIPLIMGSATPSLEAWDQIKKGTITKHILTKRLSGGKPPNIEIIHLGNGSQESKTNGCISKKLEDEMRDTLLNKKQVILFLNRRGFTHFFRCNSCSHDLQCKNCSVSLTYHKNDGVLRCHYCGWSIRPPQACPECNSLDIMYAGFGTEYIEEEVKQKFPNNTVARVDTDTLSKDNNLQTILTNFKEEKIDILLGTQIVAKGLNFPNVRLVGVVLADTGLHLPDFRAAERTFSLIVQVAGRAGRFFPDGHVIVQTFNPQRSAIECACKGDIEGFYKNELEFREMTNFPPYSRLLRLVFRSANEQLSKKSCEEAAHMLNKIVQVHNEDVDVLGPSECPLAKIAANYRNQILLRAQTARPLQRISAALLQSYKTPKNLYIEVDVDPVSLL